ncbi:aminopeptidase [Clostridia bacterium]|nr:aminopeptidase [Clostridia bacterium]
MIETIKQLCKLPGVTGHEDAVRDFIAERAKPYADELFTDKLGNLIAFRRGETDEAIMLAAHMDEVGLLVREITDEGYLRFVCAGGIDRRVLFGQRVYVGAAKIPGVVGLKAKHLSDEDERKKLPKIHEMYVDAGFASREEAEKSVELGEFIAFDDEQFEMGELFLAKALDDRVGCGVLLELLKTRHKQSVYFVFTVQEEIGTRGAFAAAFRLKPQKAIIVEGTTAADSPAMKPYKQVCKPGGGLVLPFMDGGAIYDQKLFSELRGTAEKLGLKWQTKEWISGGTDASAIQRTRGGCRVAGVSLAVRYIHSPASAAKLSEINDMQQLLREYLNN